MKLFYGIILVLMVFISACAQQPAAEPDSDGEAVEADSDGEAAEGNDAVADDSDAEANLEGEAEEEETEPEVTASGDSADIRYVGAGGFDPDTLTVNAGSSVTFFNGDSKPMVIIIFKDGRTFATPRLAPGQQSEVEFNDAGVYDYWWDIAYAAVGGQITVVEAAMEAVAEE